MSKFDESRKVVSDPSLVSCTLNSAAHPEFPLKLAPMQVALPLVGDRLWAFGFSAADIATGSAEAFRRAAVNGRLAAEGFERCHRYLGAWLREAEPTTGLIPRNLTDSPYWNGRDSVADNYPFMVLSAHFTDRATFDGPLRRMLASELQLTCTASGRPRGFRSSPGAPTCVSAQSAKAGNSASL